MPLYLDEIWFDRTRLRDAMQTFGALARGEASFPEGVRLVHGPWFSNEEAKVVLILDIADHAKTFAAFQTGVMAGLLVQRRLEPIVEWSAVDALLGG